jgi:glycosyltransferase involved in cell wall biosynthesis
VDVSALVELDLGSGIHRMVRAILQEWLQEPPPGFRVEPVCAEADGSGWRSARQWSLAFLGCPARPLPDEIASLRPGDVWLGLDWHPLAMLARKSALADLRRRGVRTMHVVHDLLPMQLPWAFLPGVEEPHRRWLEEVVLASDAALCVSRTVARELEAWRAAHAIQQPRPCRITWFHHGSDLDASAPTRGLPPDAGQVLGQLGGSRTFLMVGTLEPRKGHAQALDAFDRLWSRGGQACLAIVGKVGWMVDDLLRRLRDHPERNRRLFLLGAISDEYLEQVYAASTCLLAASEGEGFGLPLVEAARHRLPILARDLPVFREVAGAHASYFNGRGSQDLEAAVGAWLHLHSQGKHPASDALPWQTWAQSARQLAQRIQAVHGEQVDSLPALQNPSPPGGPHLSHRRGRRRHTIRIGPPCQDGTSG